MYLSIDLDFWNSRPNDLAEMETVLRVVKNSGKLRQICDNHKQILRSISKSNQTKVVNVDYHSDIVSDEDILYNRQYFRNHKNRRKKFFNCGNWVNHIPLRLKDTYVWYSPKDCGVRCDFRGRNPFVGYPPKGFKNVEVVDVEKFPVNLIDNAIDIGIAISYYYVFNKGKTRKILQKVFGRNFPQREFSLY